MKINLNDPQQFTFENVRKLIASKDDSQHRQLRVTKDGIAYLSDTIGNKDIDDLSFRLETWIAGNDYVGEAASDDDKWVEKIYKCLKANWPNPKSTFIDIF